MQSIRTRLTAGYLVVFLACAIMPLVVLRSPSGPIHTDYIAYLTLLALGALAALLFVHVMLVRLLGALALFTAAQQAAQHDELTRVDMTMLPADLVALGKSYNGMIERLEQRQQKLDGQLRRTALLTRLSIELRETFEPNEVIHDTLAVVAANTNAASASIILVGPNGVSEAAFEIAGGTCEPVSAERVRAVLDRGLAGWVLRHNRSVIVSDVAADTRWIPSEARSETRSVAALPLTHGKTTLGVLTLAHAERERFDSGDLLVLEGVAAQVGLALSAALRHAEERRLREQALLLFDMSQSLTSERSVQELATRLLTQSSAAFDTTETYLFLGDMQGQQLVWFASRNPEATPSASQAIATKLADQAWRGRETVIEALAPDSADGRGLAYVALPLLHRGTAIGAFVAARRVHGTAVFPARTWSTLTTFTNVAAAAFANVQLIHQLQHRAGELERLIDQRTTQLRYSRDMLRIVFDNLPDGLALMAQNGRLLAANNAFSQRVLGMRPQDIVGKTSDELIDSLRHSSSLTIEEQPSEGDSRRVVCTDTIGQRRWYTVDQYELEQANEVMRIERWRDVTRQEELHRQLLLHEQLSSMGRLAASVVHEVGNPLQSVQGCLELCREDPALPPTAAEYLNLASSEIERISGLLHRWRDLYRPAKTSWHAVDLNELVTTLHQITARRMTHAKVTVELALAGELALVKGQPDALRQVCLNLLLNAQEAMPQGGRIRITTASDQARRMSGFRLADTGVGMNAKQLHQIFEPFHSSRAEKLGLGLYLCKMIVEQHHGQLEMTSAVGNGTTATVWLPWDE